MAYVDKLYNHNFLEYASYVIKDRAIPHIEDGLKPVQRRILHSLFEMDDGKFHKVANVVGHCMKYHPHGDASIYSALVILANKDLFIEKQGNFGNIFTGDAASAARYIECRLLPMAKEVLYNPELTEYVDSYDGRNREPVTFPAKIPVLLVQGSEGIAVGMATKILPHNLIEVMEAQIACLQKKPFKLYPDFPTGGVIDISEYDDGNGKVFVRAKFDAKDPKRIIIREIPYGTTTESLIASIEDAAKKNKIKISSINDYTAEKVEIELHLSRGIKSKEVLRTLNAYTDCEFSLSTNFTVIINGKPAVISVTEAVKYSADKLVRILTDELQFEARALIERLFLKNLEQIFIEKRVYKKIEKIKTREKILGAVLKELKKHLPGLKTRLNRIVNTSFKNIDFDYPLKHKIEITEEDIERLLKIAIRRISLYDIEKARKEMKDITCRLKEIGKSLRGITNYSISFLKSLIKKYREFFPRKTEIFQFEQVELEDVIEQNLCLRYDGKTGYLGYELSSGKILFNVSELDRILVIRKTGTWSVMKAPDKVFIDKRMLYCGLVNKETVFNILFKDKKGYPYIKRFQIQQYILNKGYPLVSEKCRILALTTDSTKKIKLDYKPKPRVRVLHEKFKISDYLIKGNKAKGVRLAVRELKSGKFIK